MLTATETGSLVGGRDAVPAVTVPLNAPRLQGTVSAKGIDDLFVWGSGVVGRLAFEPPLTDVSAIEVRPNLVSYTVAGGTVRIAALPDRPVIVVTHSGAATTVRLSPTRGTQPGMSTRFALTRFPGGWAADSEWAAALLTATDSTPGSRGRLRVARDANTVLALGSTRAEAAAAVEDVLADPAAALRSAEAYASRLETTLVTEDAVLNGMFTACLHAACSSRKELTGGRFAGYSAGTGYVMPPRTYFRDSYWTLQALLPFAPDQAVEQVRLLAGAVGSDGEAPSGVIVASPAGERVWGARRGAEPALARDHTRPGQWWTDHFDSPFYFVLLARDALTWEAARKAATDSRAAGGWLTAALHEPFDGVSLIDRIRAVLERGARLAGDGVMPVKPDHDRDWTDNVYRHGHVTYDVALYHGALLAAAELMAVDYPDAAARYRVTAAAVSRAASERLYDAARGHFVEFRPLPGATGGGESEEGEHHLALDSLVALRTGMANQRQATATLSAAARLLETRANHSQPYGDWGVMCTYPPYRPATRRRGKSLFAYRYHNGSDWPYLDGIYAEALLTRGEPGWRYPLTRWFEYGLLRGWPTPVEYYSPPWGRGSPLNGWSAMPAAAMLLGGFGLRPSGAPHVPPWGDSDLAGVLVDGERVTVSSRAGKVSVERAELSAPKRMA